MPLVCLAFDPGIFHSRGFDDFKLFKLRPLLDSPPNEFGQVLYPLLAFQLAAMMLWLCLGWTLRRVAGWFDGVFILGAASAYLIGVLLLPMSLLGIFAMGIGLMGFTPWLTGYAYLRRAKRARTIGRQRQSNRVYFSLVAVGFLSALVIPLAITFVIFGTDPINSLADTFTIFRFDDI